MQYLYVNSRISDEWVASNNQPRHFGSPSVAHFLQGVDDAHNLRLYLLTEGHLFDQLTECYLRLYQKRTGRRIFFFRAKKYFFAFSVDIFKSVEDCTKCKVPQLHTTFDSDVPHSDAAYTKGKYITYKNL